MVIPPYYYFIIYDKIDGKIKLFSFENRNDLRECHEVQQLVQINEFSTKSEKWTNKSIFPKKYQNFHGCLMKIGAYYKANNFLRFFDNFGNIISRSENIDGPLGILMKDIAQKLNFSLAFVACKSNNCEDLVNVYYLYNVIRTTTLDGHAFSNVKGVKWRNVMLNIQCS